MKGNEGQSPKIAEALPFFGKATAKIAILEQLQSPEVLNNLTFR